MADFISGADLVARGAEGTGAAVVLNNQPTLQSLARLSGRMDNLYKTKEMMNLKLAAAKAAAKEKGPAIDMFKAGSVVSQNLSRSANQISQGVNEIYRGLYNQRLTANDNIGANQAAADVAASTLALNNAATNFDNQIKSTFERKKNYYQLTDEALQGITTAFPSIKDSELTQIQDPKKKEEYIFSKAQEFVTADPNEAIKRATLFNPNTYNYNGILSEVQDRLQNKSIKVQKANGTGYASDKSELLTSKGTLDLPKATLAVQQIPEAKLQLDYVGQKAVDDMKKNAAYQALPSDKEKEAALTKAYTDARNKYVNKVFAIGLESSTESDLQSTYAAARANWKGTQPPEEVVNGVFAFNNKTSTYTLPETENYKKFKALKPKYEEYVKTGIGMTPAQLTEYTNLKSKVEAEGSSGAAVNRNVEYSVEAVGEARNRKDFKVGPNTVFLPLGRFNEEDKKSLGAEKYQSTIPGAVNNLYVQNVQGNTGYAAEVKMPMFTQGWRDPDTGDYYKGGDFVPKDALKKMKIVDGKSVPFIERDHYMLVSGTVASPVVKTKIRSEIDPSTNLPKDVYEDAATTQNFYPDDYSFKELMRELDKNKSGGGGGSSSGGSSSTIFSGY